MKITIISDTHGEHEKLGRLTGDVLVHCGDMFNMFSPNGDDVERMDEWFGKQSFDLILCIGGNHDFPLSARAASGAPRFRNATYLEGSSHVHEGIHFYGAPWIPELDGQAFFRTPQELRREWAKIPTGVDVLITHSPPAGVLDVSSRKLQLGCGHLAARLRDVAPRLHCFGHVHASAGTVTAGNTTFVNAAMVNSQYRLARRPWEVVL
ncbi:MAG: metallophosphatase domain-containing protein [Gammaproteobacteria bacterium]|nr:metallophosphatase domain-containing protein [Gammaproteobacteria bacterium]